MKKTSFYVHLFILHDILLIINILSNKLQEKTATLGKASQVINSVIAILESNRSDQYFLSMWTKISEFSLENNLVQEIPINGNYNTVDK